MVLFLCQTTGTLKSKGQTEGMNQLLAVGAGGFLGALSRHGVTRLFLRLAGPNFPYGTLAANLLGCLMIGFMAGRIQIGRDPGDLPKLFFMTGFLGSFTTFSTFSLETYRMLEQSAWWMALANLSVHLVVGIAAVVCGFNAARLS